MQQIHPTALIDPQADLHESVAVGAYSIIGPNVRIGAGTTIGPHCVIEGHTTLGQGNQIFQFASIGAAPQDKKYRGEPTRLEIGDGNTIREFVTINTGTVQDTGVTRLGDDNWIMAYVHIAHDCHLGNHIIMANAATLGGHVHLDDWVFVGGLTGIHQFVRVGAHAMTGFQTRLSQDLPPFVTAAGNPAEAQSINAEGLKRRGYSAERITLIKQMHRLLYRKGLTLEAARQQIDALRGELADADADIALMQDFLTNASRGIVR
ncbi:acyl-ACP--UDP-N-acetylglucosamine O-acyltransferase [Ottowia thiooxydans]|uniref:acyl-ACP--UDP-N-acetylglucosamine O-acyltransferase n=1 Tax=Ottowia thiooxydans TaxID=219182 RepID=UPI00041530A4|nr:acyl-ACP--UDP-N-acetylglucosamine O-acyltransferase [Ottowia thiooxydans]